MKDNELTFDDLPKLSEEENKWWNEHNDEYIHYFYRIDNISNGKFYYGIHSEKKSSGKSPENDGYMGSGTTLNKAKKSEGIKNFKKTIIKTFSTRDEARLEEMKTVNEDLINDPNCYNSAPGGGAVNGTFGLVTVNYKDKTLRKEKFFLVPKEEYDKNKDMYITTGSEKYGKATYRDKEDPSNVRWLSVNDPLVISGKFVGISYKKTVFKNIKDPSDIRMLDLDDPLVLSGEFVGVTKGIKQSEETILKKTREKNGNFGSFWITNGIENKKVKNIEIPDGWIKGRIQIGHKLYKNIDTGEEKLFLVNEAIPDNFLPSNFFNEFGNIITKEEIYKKYEQLGDWSKVSRFFKRGERTIKDILRYYSNKIT